MGFEIFIYYATQKNMSFEGTCIESNVNGGVSTTLVFYET